MTEKELQAAVVECARLMGWRAYHTFDSRRSEPGFPDLVMVRGPRVLFRELKTAVGRITPEQDEWLADLRDAGEDADVWRPDDWTSGRIEKELK